MNTFYYIKCCEKKGWLCTGSKNNFWIILSQKKLRTGALGLNIMKCTVYPFLYLPHCKCPQSGRTIHAPWQCG